MKKMNKRLALAGIFAVVVAAGWMTYEVNTPSDLPNLPFEFSINHGSSLKSVSAQLSSVGVVRYPWSFSLLVRMLGKAGEIKAGNYLVDQNVTPLQLFYKITRGDVTQSDVTFIEGWSFRQMRRALDDMADVRHDTAGLSDQEILEKIGASEKHPEGLFFPDSYYFTSGMSDLAILKRAYQAMQAHLNKAWSERDQNLPYKDPYQALIMASIVEKETGRAIERPLIAAVFLNRLRVWMMLQPDPTVIYGIGENFDGNLHKRDLLADTPYNTYTRTGLPPTPIAMPGLDAIHAALHPGQSKAYYFVAKGDGTHYFSNNLNEHNRAVARYQKSVTAQNRVD
jgi:UPF0755 protein